MTGIDSHFVSKSSDKTSLCVKIRFKIFFFTSVKKNNKKIKSLAERGNMLMIKVIEIYFGSFLCQNGTKRFQ